MALDLGQGFLHLQMIFIFLALCLQVGRASCMGFVLLAAQLISYVLGDDLEILDNSCGKTLNWRTLALFFLMSIIPLLIKGTVMHSAALFVLLEVLAMTVVSWGQKRSSPVWAFILWFQIAI